MTSEQVQGLIPPAVNTNLINWSFFGSYVTQEEYNDIDVILLVSGDIASSRADLEAADWIDCSKAHYDSDTFVAMRKGNVNFIVTNDEKSYLSRVLAAKICKLLGQCEVVLDRDLRVNIHRLIAGELDILLERGEQTAWIT